MPYIDGRRVRGECDWCGGSTYGTLSTKCIACSKAEKAAIAVSNAEQTRENILASKRNWYYKNKERAKATHKAWLEANKDKVKQYEQEHTVERRAYVETRRAKVEGFNGTFTAQEWNGVLDMYDYKCAYCMKQFDRLELEQDHVTPLSRGGKHVIKNIVPACRHCNRTKSSSIKFPKHIMWYIINLHKG